MLQASALYGENANRKLFSNLTFKVEAGVLFWISGPNGAGKSTLLRTLLGIAEPLKGEITWQGHPIKKLDPFSFLSQLLYIGHKIGIHSILTPFENLQWWSKIHSTDLPSRGEILFALESIGLKEFVDIPCQYLSKGQQQRVALARLWLKSPICWVLDEPFTALDTDGQKLLVDRFLAHLKQGGYLIVASHYRFDLKDFKYAEIALPFLKRENE